MENYNISVQLLVNGSQVQEFPHEGNTYIEGRKGSPFSIKITNNNFFDDVLAVVSVDGLSAINSELASENSPGYVISSNSSVVVKGWRVDDENVSEFVFSKRANGYATAIQSSGHEGSIGVMIFNKKVPIMPYSSTNLWYSSTGTTSDSMTLSTTCSTTLSKDVLRSKSVDEKLAVGHGEQIESIVSSTTFDRCDEPAAVFAMFYDSKKGLESRGIILSKKPEITESSPFPASTKYCTMPENGWKK